MKLGYRQVNCHGKRDQCGDKSKSTNWGFLGKLPEQSYIRIDNQKRTQYSYTELSFL